MRFSISNNEIQSLLAKGNINIFFQPSDTREVKIGANSLLSIKVGIGVSNQTLNLRYSTGAVTGRVVNFIINLFRSRFGSIRLDLSIPGRIGVDLTSIPNANKLLDIVDITDLYFDYGDLVVEGKLK